MSGSLACARTREAAKRIVDQRHWGNVPQDALACRYRDTAIACVMDALDQAEAESAVERATGQRQLDDAWSLMDETARLLLGYASHHSARADAAERRGDLQACRDSLAKARTNLLQALRLREWCAGRDSYTVLPCPVGPVVVPADIAEDGTLVPTDDKSAESCRERFANRPGYGLVVDLPGCTTPNQAARQQRRAFSLSTGDPLFDPHEPVLINGYPFTPATEARAQCN